MRLLLLILLIQVLESVCIQKNKEDDIPLVNVKRGLPPGDDWMDCSHEYNSQTIYGRVKRLHFTATYYCGKTIGVDGKSKANTRKVTLVITVRKGHLFFHHYTLEKPEEINTLEMIPSTKEGYFEKLKKAKRILKSIYKASTDYCAAGEIITVKYHNDGEWWCHTFIGWTLFRKRDVDKCTVLDKELEMTRDKDYNSVGRKRSLAKGYTDCSGQHTPHMVCYLNDVLLTAYYMCSSMGLAYKIVATYNNMLLEEYLVSNSYTITQYNPSEIVKVCDLFHTKINQEETITIQYFKKGVWLCNDFKKEQLQQKTIYTHAMKWRKDIICPRFRDYQIP